MASNQNILTMFPEILLDFPFSDRLAIFVNHLVNISTFSRKYILDGNIMNEIILDWC